VTFTEFKDISLSFHIVYTL